MFRFNGTVYEGFAFSKDSLAKCILDYKIKNDGYYYYIENGSVTNKDGENEIIKNYIYLDTIVLKGTNYFSVQIDEVEMV